ncbi:MAG TPA: hypothetical protein VFW66_02410 [Gemmatimonadales bacterium]|nr:hypothetical protein [Gemmatimonadales bacterium]
MGLSAALKVGRTAVDTAIFIYFIEKHPDLTKIEPCRSCPERESSS